MINYYHILGLTKTATASEIKAAYRKMAVLYHPDKNPGILRAEEKFKDINQAYQVLSNPQRKAQYDFTLEYAHYALLNNLYTADKSPTYSKDKDRFTHYRRYGSYKNKRLEKIGNIWALGFLVFTIIITLIATSLNSYFEQKRQTDQLEKNIIMFDNAKQDYDKGNYQAALLKLKDMSILYSDRFDVFSFKEMIYKKMLNLADMHYDDENFQSALAYYSLVIENYQYVNVNVFYNVATCHKSLGNYLETINVLEGIANAGYHEIGNHIEIGNIFRLELQDFGQAMEHYKISIDKIEEQYLKFYGEAYPLLLNPQAFPEHHYDAYVGFGITCWHFGLNLKAMNAFDWAIFLKPNFDAAYIAKAECAISMNNMDLACESLTVAVGMGSQDALVRLVQVCD